MLPWNNSYGWTWQNKQWFWQVMKSSFNFFPLRYYYLYSNYWNYNLVNDGRLKLMLSVYILLNDYHQAPSTHSTTVFIRTKFSCNGRTDNFTLIFLNRTWCDFLGCRCSSFKFICCFSTFTLFAPVTERYYELNVYISSDFYSKNPFLIASIFVCMAILHRIVDSNWSPFARSGKQKNKFILNPYSYWYDSKIFKFELKIQATTK